MLHLTKLFLALVVIACTLLAVLLQLAPDIDRSLERQAMGTDAVRKAALFLAGESELQRERPTVARFLAASPAVARAASTDPAALGQTIAGAAAQAELTTSLESLVRSGHRATGLVADGVAVVDRMGHAIATFDPRSILPGRPGELAEVTSALTGQGGSSGLRLQDGAAVYLTVSPVLDEARTPVGAVLVGEAIDDAALARSAGRVEAEITLFAGADTLATTIEPGVLRTLTDELIDRIAANPGEHLGPLGGPGEVNFLEAEDLSSAIVAMRLSPAEDDRHPPVVALIAVRGDPPPSGFLAWLSRRGELVAGQRILITTAVAGVALLLIGWMLAELEARRLRRRITERITAEHVSVEVSRSSMEAAIPTIRPARPTTSRPPGTPIFASSEETTDEITDDEEAEEEEEEAIHEGGWLEDDEPPLQADERQRVAQTADAIDVADTLEMPEQRRAADAVVTAEPEFEEEDEAEPEAAITLLPPPLPPPSSTKKKRSTLLGMAGAVAPEGPEEYGGGVASGQWAPAVDAPKPPTKRTHGPTPIEAGQEEAGEVMEPNREPAPTDDDAVSDTDLERLGEAPPAMELDEAAGLSQPGWRDEHTRPRRSADRDPLSPWAKRDTKVKKVPGEILKMAGFEEQVRDFPAAGVTTQPKVPRPDEMASPWDVADTARVGADPSAQPRAATPSADRYERLFEQFVLTRKQCAQPVESLTLDKFRAKLTKNEARVKEQLGCAGVRFEIYIKDGKAAVKALPIRAREGDA